jgi:membrane fusion protein (multidrug efflux system)
VRRQATAEIERATAARAVAQAQLRSARAAITGAEQALAAAVADVARAEAAVAVARESLAQGVIVAPFAGTVVGIEAAVGQRVGAGVPLIRIADLGGWTFETTDLSETAIARVVEGASAVVTVDGLPDVEIAATVTSAGEYGAARQGDVVFRVVAEPTGEVPDGLRWNMTVTIEIATAE